MSFLIIDLLFFKLISFLNEHGKEVDLYCLGKNNYKGDSLKAYKKNGFIEKGQTAKILLTNSTDPFNMSSDFLNPDFFQTNVIQNATVVIIDKEKNITDTLKTTPFGISDTWFYNYEGSNILGEEGKTYHLEITHNNENYT